MLQFKRFVKAKIVFPHKNRNDIIPKKDKIFVLKILLIKLFLSLKYNITPKADNGIKVNGEG